MGGRGRGKNRGRNTNNFNGGGHFNDQFSNQGGGQYQGWQGGGQQAGGSNSNAFGSHRGRSSSGRGRGRGRGFRENDDLDMQNKDVLFINRHQDHKQAVTSIAYDDNGTLYTGSSDGFVNVYMYMPHGGPNGVRKRFQENQPFQNPMPGPVTAMLTLPGGPLLVAYTENNTGTLFCPNTSQALQVHQGAVQSMLMSTQSPPKIWTGGQDCKISVTSLELIPGATPTYAMATVGVLGPEVGGHSGGVTCVCEYVLQGVHLLVSGDTQGTMKIWDMSAGTLLQSIEQAHTKAMTGILCYSEFIITTGLDGVTLVWKSNPTPQAQAIFMPHPISDYRPNGSNGSQEPDAALCLRGCLDMSQVPWLLISRQHQSSVEFVQMNDQFTFGGTLARVNDARTVLTLDTPEERIILVGCSNGHLVVYTWKARPQ